MKRADTRRRRPAVHRARQLAAVGAGPAGAALASLLDTPVKPGAPRLRGPGDAAGYGAWSTSIVFDAEGDMTGLVAIVLPDRVRDFAIERMVGRIRPGEQLAESALRELGNIIASRTVSAIADSLGATILLSLPRLLTWETGDPLSERIAERGGSVCVETDLMGADGELRALLVIAPNEARGAAL